MSWPRKWRPGPQVNQRAGWGIPVSKGLVLNETSWQLLWLQLLLAATVIKAFLDQQLGFEEEWLSTTKFHQCQASCQWLLFVASANSTLRLRCLSCADSRCFVADFKFEGFRRFCNTCQEENQDLDPLLLAIKKTLRNVMGLIRAPHNLTQPLHAPRHAWHGQSEKS